MTRLTRPTFARPGASLAARLLALLGCVLAAVTAHAQAAPTATSKGAPDTAPVAAAGRKTSTIETADYVAEISNTSTGVASFRLKAERYTTGGDPIDVVSTTLEPYLPLRFELDGVEMGDAPVWQAEQLGPSGVRYQWQGDGMRVSRKLESGEGAYQVWATTTVHNLGDRARKVTLSTTTHHYVERADEEGPIPLLPVRAPALSNGLCRHAEDLEREPRANLPDVRAPMAFAGQVRFTGVENVYFLNALAPSGGLGERCELASSDRGLVEGEPAGSLLSAKLTLPEVSIEAGGAHTFRTLAYLGPKTPLELSAAGHSLKEAIDTGWFGVLAEVLTRLLRMIYEIVGNWGFAIILLTFVVKLVLYPLTAKQMHSMARMKELKPEMDRINELYADDREKKGAAIMELYRKEGVNPMAGCFPMLLQLPIWFSLYTSLSTNVELFRAPFAAWFTDLSRPDPYFVLPVALGALMFLQQKMSPATGGDPVQQKMMLYMMPGMITSFMLFLPAGLCLYMFTNSGLSILQQRVIESQLKQAAIGRAAAMSSTADSSDDNSSPASPSEAPVNSKTSRPSKAERRSRRGK